MADRAKTNLGGKRTAGERSAASQKLRDNSIMAIKRIWGVSEFIDIFPPGIRPTDNLGDSAIANLKAIALRVPSLSEARNLMVAECIDANGVPDKVRFSYTTNMLKRVKDAEALLNRGLKTEDTIQAPSNGNTPTAAQSSTVSTPVLVVPKATIKADPVISASTPGAALVKTPTAVPAKSSKSVEKKPVEQQYHSPGLSQVILPPNSLTPFAKRSNMKQDQSKGLLKNSALKTPSTLVANNPTEQEEIRERPSNTIIPAKSSMTAVKKPALEQERADTPSKTSIAEKTTTSVANNKALKQKKTQISSNATGLESILKTGYSGPANVPDQNAQTPANLSSNDEGHITKAGVTENKTNLEQQDKNIRGLQGDPLFQQKHTNSKKRLHSPKERTLEYSSESVPVPPTLAQEKYDNIFAPKVTHYNPIKEAQNQVTVDGPPRKKSRVTAVSNMDHTWPEPDAPDSDEICDIESDAVGIPMHMAPLSPSTSQPVSLSRNPPTHPTFGGLRLASAKKINVAKRKPNRFVPLSEREVRAEEEELDRIERVQVAKIMAQKKANHRKSHSLRAAEKIAAEALSGHDRISNEHQQGGLEGREESIGDTIEVYTRPISTKVKRAPATDRKSGDELNRDSGRPCVPVNACDSFGLKSVQIENPASPLSFPKSIQQSSTPAAAAAASVIQCKADILEMPKHMSNYILEVLHSLPGFKGLHSPMPDPLSDNIKDALKQVLGALEMADVELHSAFEQHQF